MALLWPPMEKKALVFDCKGMVKMGNGGNVP